MKKKIVIGLLMFNIVISGVGTPEAFQVYANEIQSEEGIVAEGAVQETIEEEPIEEESIEKESIAEGLIAEKKLTDEKTEEMNVAENDDQINVTGKIESSVKASDSSAESTQPGSENTNYVFDEATKTLTFTGSGKLKGVTEAMKLKPEKVIIGEGYTVIGKNCFKGNKTLKQVVLPESVTTIEANAFNGCKKLTDINFLQALTFINSEAFEGTALKEVVLPRGLKKIGSFAFYGCNKLKSITIPASVEKFGNYICARSNALKEVEYDAVEVPYQAFYGCGNLEKVVFKGEIKRLSSSCFSHTGIKEMVIPNTVDELGSNVFYGCRKLTKLVISKNVNIIPAYLCGDTDSLKTVKIQNGTTEISHCAFCGSGIKNIEIPKSVEKIGTRAFAYCKKLKRITIPDKVQQIKKETFVECIKLTKIDFGKGVQTIGEGVFKGCDLNVVKIPANIRFLGYESFKNSGARKVIIESGVKKIGNWAFSDNKNLEYISISETVQSIEPNSFIGCGKLKGFNVAAQNSNYSVSDGMLLSKSGATLYCCPAGKTGTVNIPASVKNLTEYSFSGCKKVKGYSVSSSNSKFSSKDGILFDKTGSVLVRYPEGFKGEVKVPSSVKEIGEYAFANCRMSGIKFNENLKTIGIGAFENCKNIESIRIPGNVTTIGKAAFWNCGNLKTVRLLSGVKKIKELAFSECYNLKKIMIPTSVTSISGTAFSDSYRVTIYCSKISTAMDFAKKKNISYKLV